VARAFGKGCSSRLKAHRYLSGPGRQRDVHRCAGYKQSESDLVQTGGGAGEVSVEAACCAQDAQGVDDVFLCVTVHVIANLNVSERGEPIRKVAFPFFRYASVAVEGSFKASFLRLILFRSSV
jgi:hypothetical protein